MAGHILVTSPAGWAGTENRRGTAGSIVAVPCDGSQRGMMSGTGCSSLTKPRQLLLAIVHAHAACRKHIGSGKPHAIMKGSAPEASANAQTTGTKRRRVTRGEARRHSLGVGPVLICRRRD